MEELLTHNKEIKPLSCQLVHTFTPGLYSRQITMPKDSLILSEIHLTEHQFIISKGIACVKVNENDWEILEAPYHGITKPGTCRLLGITEECVWTTFHPATEYPENETPEAFLKAVAQIESRIIEKRELSVEDINSHLIEMQ